MNRPILQMILSSRLLAFSYLKYLAHDPPFVPPHHSRYTRFQSPRPQND